MDMKTRAPLVWLLLGNRQGDNNQLFALAEGLGLPYESKHLTHNHLRRFRFLRGPRLISLTREARQLIRPPWPDLVIGVGYGSVPVGRYIRKQTRGRTKLVQIGNPRTSINDLDLLITTPQYSRPPAANVLALPFPIGNPARLARAAGGEEDWLRAFPPPRRLIAIGGPANNWKLDWPELEQAVLKAQDMSVRDGGSLIVVSSARTPRRIKVLIEGLLSEPATTLTEDFPRFGVLLANSDEIFVTADSVSMLSEAIFTGKPVGMIPVRRSLRGMFSKAFRELPMNRPPFPDLPRFWNFLAEHRLAGSVDAPLASAASDTISIAVDRVRGLLTECPSERS
jgi:uncharacterized protein